MLLQVLGVERLGDDQQRHEARDVGAALDLAVEVAFLRRSRRIKMAPQNLQRNVSRGLPHDRTKRSRIQLAMPRYGQRLALP